MTLLKNIAVVMKVETEIFGSIAASIISLKSKLFSPWYSWKIAELALSNNHALTPVGLDAILATILMSVSTSITTTGWYCQYQRTDSDTGKKRPFRRSRHTLSLVSSSYRTRCYTTENFCLDFSPTGVSAWLLLNANSAIFQLYHGENNLLFNEMMMKSPIGQAVILVIMYVGTFKTDVIIFFGKVTIDKGKQITNNYNL
jgi:hypothetical protein